VSSFAVKRARYAKRTLTFFTGRHAFNLGAVQDFYLLGGGELYTLVSDLSRRIKAYSKVKEMFAFLHSSVTAWEKQ